MAHNDLTLLSAALHAQTRPPETKVLPHLFAQATLAPDQRAASRELAYRLAEKARSASHGTRTSWIQDLLHTFPLHTNEGMALMSLAEALLRIPDRTTRDALMREHLSAGNWRAFVPNQTLSVAQAATLGLCFVRWMFASDTPLSTPGRQALGRLGTPVIDRIMNLAIRTLGQHFVIGQSISAALKASRRRTQQGFTFSFDMLGEAALTHADAQRYHAAYAEAIAAMAQSAPASPIERRPGISIKLSALHPRFCLHQRKRVHNELYPRLLDLAERAAAANLGLNLDAEESERLTLSLELFERLSLEPRLRHWPGLGAVVQAYQKRAAPLIDVLIALARQRGQRLMVRLVKGAYWDSEIKRAQLEGLSDYPVLTRKAHTDIAYFACARRLLDAGPWIYPQFATHNAQTVANVMILAGIDSPVDRYEFQCLHGMGEALYAHVVAPKHTGGLARPCRIYAPVGSHDTLLAYLVRRLLENGANTSFVHQLANSEVPLEQILTDPVDQVQARAHSGTPLGAPHPAIPIPRALYGAMRRNALGLDLHDPVTLTELDQALAACAQRLWHAAPLHTTDHQGRAPDGTTHEGAQAVSNPAQPAHTVGWVRTATEPIINEALTRALQAQAAWEALPPAKRAHCLETAANRLEAAQRSLIALLVLEAGKTRSAAVAEVREAIDALRYNAAQIPSDCDPVPYQALGPVVCISPWNFPLAIFVGQIAAALAAGNTVLAKPAAQTPLIAAQAVAHLHSAGIPESVLQLLPGEGTTVGAALTADPRVQGVLFTGSGSVARHIQSVLAQRLDARGNPVTFIAETGGLNAMVVDSSALPEQVVTDIVTSAFDSAGQRCSALRIVCLQEDVADSILTLLRGAMTELKTGDPRHLDTDIGPVIDEAARTAITHHIEAMRAAGWPVWQAHASNPNTGYHVAPTLIEIDTPATLGAEIFGPVLHVVRYRACELDTLLANLRRSGYGLTFGVHSRVESTLTRALSGIHAGNLYVNRSMIGAVVGVQPFGGEGLSGTGPKAGGPLYLLRLLARCPAHAARQRLEACGPLHQAAPEAGTRWLARLHRQEDQHDPRAADRALQSFLHWTQATHNPALKSQTQAFLAHAPVTGWRRLPGPTGQCDVYEVRVRRGILGLASTDTDRLIQLAAVLALGGTLHWPESARPLYTQMPVAVQNRIQLLADWRTADGTLSVVIQHAPPETQRTLAQMLAARPGPIVGLVALAPGATAVPLERLVQERALSINTAASGGNASLMALRDPPLPPS